MGNEEAERIQQELKLIAERFLPPQPQSEKWQMRGNGLLILSPLEKADVEVLLEAPNLRILSFEQMPPVETWSILNDVFFSRRPDVCLRVCNWWKRHDEFASLGFLDHLPNVRDFDVSDVRVKDATALSRHPGLNGLGLYGRFSRRITLDFLASHRSLRSLGLGGFGFVPKGIDRVSDLAELEQFTTGQGFPTLAFLVPLENLRYVSLGLAANHDMDSLGRIPNLERLELRRVRMLSDLSGLAQSRSLKHLTLDELRNVQSVAWAAGIETLEELSLCALKGLESLDGIADHPTLRVLRVFPEHRLPEQEWLRLATCKRLEVLDGVIPARVEPELRAALPACRINSDRRSTEGRH